MIFILQHWNSGKSNHFSINIADIQYKTDPIHGLTKVVAYFALERFFPWYSGFPVSSKTNICRDLA